MTALGPIVRHHLRPSAFRPYVKLYTYDYHHLLSSRRPLDQRPPKDARQKHRPLALVPCAEAITTYLDTNEWKSRALSRPLLPAGKGTPHERVVHWVKSWETRKEQKALRAV